MRKEMILRHREVTLQQIVMCVSVYTRLNLVESQDANATQRHVRSTLSVRYISKTKDKRQISSVINSVILQVATCK